MRDEKCRFGIISSESAFLISDESALLANISLKKLINSQHSINFLTHISRT
jgi:hypothetical protein